MAITIIAESHESKYVYKAASEIKGKACALGIALHQLKHSDLC